MAVTKKAQKTVDSWKKKRWHRILAPKLFHEQVIGETPSLEPDMVMGRTVAVSLMNLTRDMKKQGIYMTFEVSKVMGDTAYTHVKKYEMTSSSIKRMVRRKRDRVDDSFVCTTADNVPVRLKPLMLTRSPSRNSIGTALRKASRNFLMRAVHKVPYDILLQDIVSNKLQKAWRDSMKNIFPLKICDIRVLSLELKDKKLEEVIAAAPPVEEAPAVQQEEESKPKRAKKEAETGEPEQAEEKE